MNTRAHYDVAIIGAGMSGLAAGIRLAHFGKKVCIFERHNAPGGLNSFYSIAGRKFDVGLHAMTNFVRPGVKGTPLTKLLRQLRIDRDEFALCEQKQSRIAFGPRGEISLRFTNDFGVLESEVAARFPAHIDGFRQLVEIIRGYDDVSLDAAPESARAIVRRHISDPLFEDMLFCPLMYYGSATERDMEFGQFVIMFKALFFEGFARPFEGVRTVIRVLLEKYRAAGGERRMKCGVREIVVRNVRAAALVLDNGDEITADHIISSIGIAETEQLLRAETPPSAVRYPKSEIPPGRLSFVETITVLKDQPAAFGWGSDTIIFFNDSERFDYARPAAPVDPRSGVICIPNNFDFGPGRLLSEGFVRVTCLANYDPWANWPEETYREEKQRWFAKVQRSARRFLPPLADETAFERTIIATDMFTPRTITKFTGHLGGAIYGAPTKNRQGRTALSNLYLCGTDQGFLGIVGAMLSGISMANYHILVARPSAPPK
ncbi:MAG: NAD(P)/FAD-dependent oxidoreductase [Opitutaceae bacterium]|nr:NAD(P)/FAD-dependent oxidoreductase [Opitutaceae bacterium]